MRASFQNTFKLLVVTTFLLSTGCLAPGDSKQKPKKISQEGLLELIEFTESLAESEFKNKKDGDSAKYKSQNIDKLKNASDLDPVEKLKKRFKFVLSAKVHADMYLVGDSKDEYMSRIDDLLDGKIDSVQFASGSSSVELSNLDSGSIVLNLSEPQVESVEVSVEVTIGEESSVKKVVFEAGQTEQSLSYAAIAGDAQAALNISLKIKSATVVRVGQASMHLAVITVAQNDEPDDGEEEPEEPGDMPSGEDGLNVVIVKDKDSKTAEYFSESFLAQNTDQPYKLVITPSKVEKESSCSKKGFFKNLFCNIGKKISSKFKSVEVSATFNGSSLFEDQKFYAESEPYELPLQLISSNTLELKLVGSNIVQLSVQVVPDAGSELAQWLAQDTSQCSKNTIELVRGDDKTLYSSINLALAAASKGDSVVLGAGQYEEIVRIQGKDGISLRSDCLAEIRGLEIIDAKWTKVSGLIVRPVLGGSDSVSIASKSHKVELDRIAVIRDSGQGNGIVFKDKVYDVESTNLYVSGHENGISVSKSAKVKISNSVIERNRQNGVLADHFGVISLSNNVIKNNGLAEAGSENSYGLKIADSFKGHLSLGNNVIAGNNGKITTKAVSKGFFKWKKKTDIVLVASEDIYGFRDAYVYKSKVVETSQGSEGDSYEAVQDSARPIIVSGLMDEVEITELGYQLRLYVEDKSSVTSQVYVNDVLVLETSKSFISFVPDFEKGENSVRIVSSDVVSGQVSERVLPIINYDAFDPLAGFDCSSPAQKIYRVSPDAVNEYPLVQQAMDAAIDGDTVILTQGEYLGHITIREKKNVALRSVCDAKIENISVIESERVAIDGLLISPKTDVAVFLGAGSRSISVTNNKINGQDSAARGVVFGENVEQAVIRDNIIENFVWDGLLILHKSGGETFISENLIRYNGANGIVINAGHPFFLERNTIVLNGKRSFAGEGYGAKFIGEAQGALQVVTGNVITGNSGAIVEGESSMDIFGLRTLESPIIFSNETTTGEELVIGAIIFVDNDAPAISTSLEKNLHTQSNSINFNANSFDKSESSIVVLKNGMILSPSSSLSNHFATDLVAGLNLFELTATDEYGNVSQTEYYRVYRDNNPPQILSSVPENGSVFNSSVSSIFVSFKANEPLSRATVNGLGMTSNSDGTQFSSLILPVNNSASISFELTDLAGNVSQETISFEVSVDSRAPVISVSQPEIIFMTDAPTGDGAIVVNQPGSDLETFPPPRGVSFTVIVSDSDSADDSASTDEEIPVATTPDVRTLVYQNDAVIFDSKLPPAGQSPTDGEYLINATLENGENLFVVEAIDAVGNYTSYELDPVEFDNVPPVLLTLSPLAGETYMVGDNIEISGTSNEELEEVRIGGQLASLSPDGLQFNYSLPNFDGVAVVEVKIIDKFQNETIAKLPLAESIDENGAPAVVVLGRDAERDTHTCAAVNGAAYCWGHNNNRQLGTGGWGNSSVPVSVVGMESGVTDIKSGPLEFSCGIQNDVVKCWGRNDKGQLGRGFISSSEGLAAPVVGLEGRPVQLELGQAFGCVRNDVGKVQCWGWGTVGRLGNNSEAIQSTPVTPVGLENGVTNIHVFSLGFCANKGSEFLCAGFNYPYEGSPYGRTSVQIWREPMQNLQVFHGEVRKMTKGQDHVCALDDRGVVCWGRNRFGQVGTEQDFLYGGFNITKPKVVESLQGKNVTDVVALSQATCALAEGKMYCFGWNQFSQLGVQGLPDYTSPQNGAVGQATWEPVTPVGMDSGVTQIVGQKAFTNCAVKDGEVYCWGESKNGATGTGQSGGNVLYPTKVSGLPTTGVKPVIASFSASPYSGSVPLAVSFDASSSTAASGVISNYYWDFGDGNSASSTEPTTDHTYFAPGSFLATLTVTDNQGNQASYSQYVVGNQGDGPYMELVYYQNTDGGLGIVEFNASRSVGISSDIERLVWDFGDGNSHESYDLNAPVYHEYQTQGYFPVSVTGFQEDGRFSTTTRTVFVSDFYYPYIFLDQADDQSEPILIYEEQFEISGGSTEGLESLTMNGLELSLDENLSFSEVVSFNEYGAIPLHFVATDYAGNTSQTTYTLDYRAGGAPDIFFDATPMLGNTPLTVSFDATPILENDSSIVSYEWDFGNGEYGSGLTTSATFSDAGIYTVILVTTNEDGVESEVEVDVEAIFNSQPLAEMSADTYVGSVPLLVNFDSIGSYDPDGTIASYQWNFGDGSTAVGPTATHTFNKAGTYTATLKLTDDSGNTTTRGVVITAESNGGVPIAVIELNKTQGEAPLAVSASGSKSVDDIEVVRFDWFVNGVLQHSGETANFNFSEARGYEVKLVVTDSDGNTGQAISVVNVTSDNNHRPTAVISGRIEVQEFVQSIHDGQGFSFDSAPVKLALDSSYSTDLDDDINSIKWDFDDGDTSLASSTVRTFYNPGVYVVQLTVEDSKGLSETSQIVVEIEDSVCNDSIEYNSCAVVVGADNQGQLNLDDSDVLQMKLVGVDSQDTDSEISTFKVLSGDIEVNLDDGYEIQQGSVLVSRAAIEGALGENLGKSFQLAATVSSEESGTFYTAKTQTLKFKSSSVLLSLEDDISVEYATLINHSVGTDMSVDIEGSAGQSFEISGLTEGRYELRAEKSGLAVIEFFDVFHGVTSSIRVRNSLVTPSGEAPEYYPPKVSQNDEEASSVTQGSLISAGLDGVEINDKYPFFAGVGYSNNALATFAAGRAPGTSGGTEVYGDRIDVKKQVNGYGWPSTVVDSVYSKSRYMSQSMPVDFSAGPPNVFIGCSMWDADWFVDKGAVRKAYNYARSFERLQKRRIVLGTESKKQYDACNALYDSGNYVGYTNCRDAYSSNPIHAELNSIYIQEQQVYQALHGSIVGFSKNNSSRYFMENTWEYGIGALLDGGADKEFTLFGQYYVMKDGKKQKIGAPVSVVKFTSSEMENGVTYEGQKGQNPFADPLLHSRYLISSLKLPPPPKLADGETDLSVSFFIQRMNDKPNKFVDVRIDTIGSGFVHWDLRPNYTTTEYGDPGFARGQDESWFLSQYGNYDMPKFTDTFDDNFSVACWSVKPDLAITEINYFFGDELVWADNGYQRLYAKVDRVVSAQSGPPSYAERENSKRLFFENLIPLGSELPIVTGQNIFQTGFPEVMPISGSIPTPAVKPNGKESDYNSFAYVEATAGQDVEWSGVQVELVTDSGLVVKNGVFARTHSFPPVNLKKGEKALIRIPIDVNALKEDLQGASSGVNVKDLKFDEIFFKLKPIGTKESGSKELSSIFRAKKMKLLHDLRKQNFLQYAGSRVTAYVERKMVEIAREINNISESRNDIESAFRHNDGALPYGGETDDHDGHKTGRELDIGMLTQYDNNAENIKQDLQSVLADFTEGRTFDPASIAGWITRTRTRIADVSLAVNSQPDVPNPKILITSGIKCRGLGRGCFGEKIFPSSQSFFNICERVYPALVYPADNARCLTATSDAVISFDEAWVKVLLEDGRLPIVYNGITFPTVKADLEKELSIESAWSPAVGGALSSPQGFLKYYTDRGVHLNHLHLEYSESR